MMKKILAGCAVVLAIAACGGDDGPTGPQPIPAGRLSLSLPAYAGQPASTFSAQGAITRDSVAYFTLGNYAFGQMGPHAHSPLHVFASAPAGTAGQYHYLEMHLPSDVQAGAVVPLTRGCRKQATDCGGVQVTLDMPNTRPAEWTNGTVACVPATANGGSVRIATRTEARVTGTFTLTADCVKPAAEVSFQHTVTDGSFDVPIVQPGDYPPVTP